VQALRLPTFVPVYRGWWIVLTGYLTQMASSGASGWVFGVLIIPMQDDLGWSRSTIVGVLTLNRLVAGACGFWLGPMVDRHGARLLITVSSLAGGACLVCLALIDAPWQSYVLWGVFGVTLPGLSTLGPIAAISNWFIRKRAQAIMFFTFGSAMAGLVLAPLMASVAAEMSWRVAWLLMGLLLWAIAPLAWFAIRRRPEDLGLQPDGDGSGTVQAASDEARPALEEPRWTAAMAVRSRAFWLLTLGFMLTMLPASSIFIHMSAYVQSKGFSVEEGAAAVSIYGLGAVAGRFVWGFTVARAGLHKSLVAWGALYGLSILVYTLPSQIFAIYATTILLGISIAGSQQLRAQTYPDYFGREVVGTLVGYSTLVGTLAGAAGPLLVAIAFDATGSYDETYVAFGLCCIAAAVGFAFSRPRETAPATSAVLRGTGS
jgi:sugar phosphate permease